MRASFAVRRAIGVTAVAGTLLWGVVGASAAPIGGSGSVPVGGGTATVTTCATGGVTFEYVNEWNTGLGDLRTVAVRVRGLASPACDGSTVLVVVRSQTGLSMGSGSAVVAGPNLEVPITSPPGGATAVWVGGAAVILLG